MRENMNKVTVDKEELLSTLRSNRDSHIDEYGNSITDWAEAQATILHEALSKFENVFDEMDLLDHNIEILAKPSDYSKQYDLAIEMLEWSIDDTVTLTQEQFQQFVLDEWSWKMGFKANNNYISSKLT